MCLITYITGTLGSFSRTNQLYTALQHLAYFSHSYMENLLDEDRCSQVSNSRRTDRAGFDGKLSHLNTEVARSCSAFSGNSTRAAITILGITMVSKSLTSLFPWFPTGKWREATKCRVVQKMDIGVELLGRQKR